MSNHLKLHQTMKKFLSLFLGCLAALVIAVSFSACNPKDKNNASVEYALIGTWQWVYSQYNLSYVLTVNSTHTGSIVATSVSGGNASQANFYWSMVSEDVVLLAITSGSLPGLDELGNTLTMKVTFPGSNMLLFTLNTPPYTSFGPFIKTSGPTQQGNQPQQGDQPGSEKAITMANLAGNWILVAGRSSSEPNFSNWTDETTTLNLTSNGLYTTTGAFSPSDEPLSGTYTLSGSTVLVYAEGMQTPSLYITIISLTSNELILQMEGKYYYKFSRIS